MQGVILNSKASLICPLKTHFCLVDQLTCTLSSPSHFNLQWKTLNYFSFSYHFTPNSAVGQGLSDSSGGKVKPLGNILQLRTQWVISILRKKYIKCAHLFFIAMATAITTRVSSSSAEELNHLASPDNFMLKFFNSTPSVCLGHSIFNRLSEINVVLMSHSAYAGCTT